jgi:hypothetical protein
MAEKSLSDQLSQLINDTPEIEPAPVEEKADAQPDVLVDSLKAIAGQSDGALETALDEFMSGKGVLHETTRSALTRGGDSALTEVVKLLTSQFKLSPAVAKMIASLILKLQLSGGNETGKEATTKKKPRRKAKPKTSAAKKETSSAKKKAAAKAKKAAAKAAAKKKAASKAKPRSTKKTASKTAAKKKPAAKAAKKKTTAKAKPKKAKRASTVEVA